MVNHQALTAAMIDSREFLMAKRRGLIPLAQVAPSRLFLFVGQPKTVTGGQQHCRRPLGHPSSHPSLAAFQSSVEPTVVVT
jgi:hypothetical protein